MIILYPGYSFETLSTDRTADDARQLLTAWSAAFHPALLEKFEEIPAWESASVPPYDISKQPILIPPCSESYMQDDWFERQETEGGLLVRNLTGRQEILDRLFQLAEIDGDGFDYDYVNAVSALGTTYFLTDLLVRQLHYMSMVDDSQCRTHLFNSIRTYRQEDREGAMDLLGQAFDAVCQSKEYFYPIQTYFLDLTLATQTTVGEAFRKLIQVRPQTNLFLSSRFLRTMSQSEPQSFDVLKSACKEGKIQFVVDDTEERSLLLLPILDIADRVLEGISIYRELLEVSPTIYGRLRVGLTPLLPQLLKLAGIKGVLHFAPLDGWHLKENIQSKMIWQGVDGTKIDALIRYPLNSSSDLDFFSLADQLGESINNDQSPTAVFARFPKQQDQDISWLDDLHRMSHFSGDLGNFCSIEKYFEDTPQCGGVKELGFGKYPFNVLEETVEAEEENSISCWNTVHKESVSRTVLSVFETLLTLLKQPPDERLIVKQLAETICSQMEKSEYPGVFITNPWSFPRRVYLDISHWKSLPDESTPVILAKQLENRKEIAVDIPPMGYAFIEPSQDDESKTKSERKRSGLLGFFKKATTEESVLINQAEDDLGKNSKRPVFILKNEHFEVKIDKLTGMVRSVFTLNSRFNRLSQQLGFRLPKEQRIEDSRSQSDPNRGYAISVADDISIEQAGPITGKLKIQGRLVCPDGSTAANYTETIAIRRRSRLLEFSVELEPKQQPGEILWDSYFALRRAWNDNTLNLRGCLGDGSHELSGSRIQSPRFVDLRNDKYSLTFFSEGLPFHRRFGERQLDTILIAGKEKERCFRYGIGIDLRYPVPASLEFLAPKEELFIETFGRSKDPSAWLFQVEAKNVVALHCEPFFEKKEGDDTGSEQAVGLRIFLLETEGRRAHFALHSFLPPTKASATNLFGEELKELKTDGDSVLIDMRGHELLPLDIRFQ